MQQRTAQLLGLVRSVGVALCLLGTMGACQQGLAWTLHPVNASGGLVHALQDRSHALPTGSFIAMGGVALGLLLLVAAAQPAPPRVGARRCQHASTQRHTTASRRTP